MVIINIYADESCHLQNDKNDIMVLGGITCPYNLKSNVFNDIRQIKLKHGLSSWLEIKWTKVSDSKIDFYIDLVDYFFNNEALSFRGIVATNKMGLDHSKYNNGDYNTWYYKMYFLLLAPLVDPLNEYKIYIDIKDTNGGPKVKKLREVLCNNVYDFKQEVINDLVQINSNESEIMQLTDLFIGALSYYHRAIYLGDHANKAKVKIIEHLLDIYHVDLSKKTELRERKFNIFIWKPRGI